MVLWIIGIGYVVVIFLVQTLLLRTSQKRILHLLPLILIGVVYLAAACLPALDGIMAELGRNDGFTGALDLCVSHIAFVVHLFDR